MNMTVRLPRLSGLATALTLLLSAAALTAADFKSGFNSVRTQPLYSTRSSSNRMSVENAGAVGDGLKLNTTNIQAAIELLARQGGGTLIIPRGVFLSGAIFLKPSVNLYLEEGAVLKGSTNESDYPERMTRVEGHFEKWLPALINADHADHLCISGAGTIDGNGAPFWEKFWTRIKANRKTANLDVERPRLVFIEASKDVRISGITFKDSAFWNLHLYRCQGVIIENARFEVPNGVKCPSTDGADVDSCQNVTIRGCTFRVNDDCIVLKGSKGPFALADKDSPPVEHIRVSDCSFERGDGVVTFGSEATIVRDVVVENCQVSGSINLVRLKLRPDTPQVYEDIQYRNITLEGTGTILDVKPWIQYFDLKGQPPPKSVVRNLTLANVRGRYGAFGTIAGNLGQTEISDATLKNINVQLDKIELVAGTVRNLKIKNVLVNGKAFSSTATSQ